MRTQNGRAVGLHIHPPHHNKRPSKLCYHPCHFQLKPPSHVIITSFESYPTNDSTINLTPFPLLSPSLMKSHPTYILPYPPFCSISRSIFFIFKDVCPYFIPIFFLSFFFVSFFISSLLIFR